jgi:hypothetical protein
MSSKRKHDSVERYNKMFILQEYVVLRHYKLDIMSLDIGNLKTKRRILGSILIEELLKRNMEEI